MRRFFWLPALVLFALPVHSATPVQVSIRQFGLGGAHAYDSGITWVQVSVGNPGSSAVALRLEVAQLNLEMGALPVAQAPSYSLQLAPGEERVVDVGIQLQPGDGRHTVIYAQAIGPDGLVLGRAGRRVASSNRDRVIAVLCATADGCNAVRQRILLAGTPAEQAARSENIRLVQLLEAPAAGWAYGRADVVVVAMPAARLSSAQQEALELYLLEGGKLILVKDRLGEPARSPQLLAPYRNRVPDGLVVSAGGGHLVQLASASSAAFLEYLFPEPPSQPTDENERRLAASLRAMTHKGDNGSGAPWVLMRTGTAFRFPSFPSLLLWILAYLGCAVILNFVVLRRLGRPEWGWATIPTFAVLFSFFLYVVSVRTHPRTFGISEAVVYRMSDRSGLSAVSAKVRVSVPSRSLVTLSMPREVSYWEQSPGFRLDLGPLLSRSAAARVFDLTAQDDLRMRMLLRRWSYRDLDFNGVHRFSGTVHRDERGFLHNDTGTAFASAILVKTGDVLLLGKFPAGAALDLSRVPRLDYRSETGRRAEGVAYPGPSFGHESTPVAQGLPESQILSFQREYQALASEPFSLLELIRGWPEDDAKVFLETKAVFFGLGGPSLNPTLVSQEAGRSTSAVVEVTFGEWP